jgi:hypothetical protein
MEPMGQPVQPIRTLTTKWIRTRDVNSAVFGQAGLVRQADAGLQRNVIKFEPARRSTSAFLKEHALRGSGKYANY